MQPKKLPTAFAPAELASPDKLQQQITDVLESGLVASLLDAVPNVFLILNRYRQIVYANRALLDLIGVQDEHTLYGLRLGEVLNCTHASETEGGCGTTEFCRTCGAVQAMITSLKGKSDVQECRISRAGGDSIDLRVWAKPFLVRNDQYSVFTAVDISHEKRRQVLERIFFHDVLNTAGNLQGVSWLLQEAPDEEFEELRELTSRLSTRLVSEIEMQRDLVAAENGELQPDFVPLESLDFLNEILNSYRRHDLSRDRVLRLDEAAQSIAFVSDKLLLGRIIGNLIKNGLEASLPGQDVTVSCRREGTSILFWIHNLTVMPRKVQLQIFQRSFSTKGKGRGLGTYSIKFLSEHYLQGQVSFTSTPETGTTFTVFYPLYPLA